MRELTFRGYLERYVRSLSSCKTNSVFKLAAEAQVNYRLREPLFLYALNTGKTDILLRATAGSGLHLQYVEMADRYSWEKMLEALESKNESLDRSYHKTYRSYISRRYTSRTDSDTKALMHKKIRRLQNTKGISNYRLYTDLRLNPSNVNSFLKSGDVNKVSLERAREMIAYLESAFS